MHRRNILCQLSLPKKKSAEAEENEFRLAADNVPEKPGGFVAINFAQRFARRGV
jgi:hypothetical protein